MNYLEKIIPQTLGLYNTFFTQMILVGKCNECKNLGIPPHLDEDDIISRIITLGSSNDGGDTNYYDGLKNNMFEVKYFWFCLNINSYRLDIITKFTMVFVLGLTIELN